MFYNIVMADAALGCICHSFVVVLKLCEELQTVLMTDLDLTRPPSPPTGKEDACFMVDNHSFRSGFHLITSDIHLPNYTP